MALSHSFFFFFFFLTVPVAGLHFAGDGSSTASLDHSIKNSAFRSFPHYPTGTPYPVSVPANFTGATATAIRIRSSDLWLRGTNVSSLHLPPGIFTAPYVRRLLLIFLNLGNLSSSYTVAGYSLIAPVIGFFAFDASNSSKELTLLRTRRLISINFPAIASPDGANSTAVARCVRFGLNGLAHVGGNAAGMTCAATGSGGFSIVVPAAAQPLTPPLATAAEEEGRRWWVWMSVWVAVGLGLVLAGMVGLGIRRKKMEEMERKAEEGEALESVWVGRSKMPTAAAARTPPEIESDSVLRVS